MLIKLHAFLLGMWEFRSLRVANLYRLDLIKAYDQGQQFAHALTLQRFR